jgi:transcriptional regulator with XRE-family HTH domain
MSLFGPSRHFAALRDLVAIGAIADTGQQCRAARGLLDWTQEVLAEVARIGIATVRQFEGGHADSRQATLAVLRRAFEEAGVDFIDENGGGPGVRMRRRQARKRKNA